MWKLSPACFRTHSGYSGQYDSLNHSSPYLILNTETNLVIEGHSFPGSAAHAKMILNEHESSNGRPAVYEVIITPDWLRGKFPTKRWNTVIQEKIDSGELK